MSIDRDQIAKRREALKARLAERIEAAKAGKGHQERRRLPWFPWSLVIILLLLLLWQSCEEEPEPCPECEICEDCTPGEPVETEVKPVPKPIKKGRIKKRSRPPFETKPPDKLTWLGAFKLQVAARSPRLAACFVGAENPGTLKWTTSVQASSGRVAEHKLEPMLASASLSRDERTCVLEVLGSPAYTLQPDKEPSTPSRVAMVIEF